jgi:beta-phosphoglucomutase-like phosphatase (HAD superfamily)
MQPIEAILFDPVGSLAEFRVKEFEAIARQLIGEAPAAARSGSEAYWNVVNLLDVRGWSPKTFDHPAIDAFELEAVDCAALYEDAVPALVALKGLGVQLILASSLSEVAVARFLERASLGDAFGGCWSRDRAGGVSHVPLARAREDVAVAPDRALCLVDTAIGLRAAKRAGVQPILMMNDPDDAMTLTQHEPAGGIVSLHELPDFVRLVAVNAARRRTPSA